jgi:hypothetical protein
MGDDAGAAADEIVARMLEYLDVPAGAVKEVGREKAAQRAAGDERPPLGCKRHRRRA